LSGVRAGAVDEPGTVNELVAARLRQMAEMLRDRPRTEARIIEERPSEPPPPKPPAPPEPPR
ncbi:MAG: hypothetical protein ACREQF_13235, partial [Candidatus Binataceae bacterium]